MFQYIALCGYPKAGKTEVQNIISRLYGFTPCDDSLPLRQGAKALYGLTDWHVSTQEGKASLVRVGERMVTVRKLMGDLGCYLEKDDEFHLPRLALRTCAEQDPGGRYAFASVRQRQPDFFKQTANALVVEVTRAGCHPSDDFDEYSRHSIDVSIENYRNSDDPTASLRELETRVRAMLDPIFLPETVAA